MPMSVLWAGLIIAWLVVLVPMLVARHPRVKSVTDATLKTRLLHRGDSRRLRPRRMRHTGARRAAEGDGLDGADLDGADLDGADLDGADLDGADLDSADLDGAPAANERGDHAAVLDELDEAHAFVDSDVDGLPDSGPLDGETAEIVAARRPVDRTEGDGAGGLVAEAGAGSAPAEPGVDAGDLRTAPVRTMAQLDEGDDIASEARGEAESTWVEDSAADLDETESVTAELDPAEPGAAEPGPPPDEAEADDVELDAAARVRAGAAVDEFSESAETARRRAGFDPDNDARLTAARYRFRQRITFVLAIVAVGALAAGLLGLPFGWYGFGGAVVAFALYLAYLRRTVRIETDIRRRRMARLERARRERAQQAEIVEGVPAHLRRYGAIVLEADDEDPAFDHLPRYRAEEFDFLDQSDDQGERLRRAVG